MTVAGSPSPPAKPSLRDLLRHDGPAHFLDDVQILVDPDRPRRAAPALFGGFH